ncbi:hypothetical protein LCGC14_1322110 [marine sediment metagenome]|uniref:Uncharacterized protein n=1 Tax=marine sediment metagenome TaxID=412755 RepID=A0A0F9L4P7_9ZZZZ
MTFKLADQKPRTQVWQLTNNASGLLLGVISWYGAWRQYAFNPVEGSTFNDSCLETIRDFLTKLNSGQKSGRGTKCIQVG